MRMLDEHMDALRADGRQNALFGAVYCQYALAGWSESVGVRLSDVPEDDQRDVSALNVTHAPMLGVACGQIKPQKAQYGADGEARRAEPRRGEDGRMSLAPANALKHAKD